MASVGKSVTWALSKLSQENIARVCQVKTSDYCLERERGHTKPSGISAEYRSHRLGPGIDGALRVE